MRLLEKEKKLNLRFTQNGIFKMKHRCEQCGADNSACLKTWPYRDYTLRQHRCKECKTNFFSCEYIMERAEYRWFNNKSRNSRIDLIEK